MPTPEAVTYEAECVICGITFTAERRWKHHEGRSTCSISCSVILAHRRKKGLAPVVLEMEKDCPACGIHFVAKRRTAKVLFNEYCSRSCANAANGRLARDDSWERTAQQTCVVCGTEFLATKRKKTDHFRSYCSIECSAQLRTTRLKRQCKFCGAIFWQQRSVVERAGRRSGCYCSQACYHADRQNNSQITGRRFDKGYVLVYAPEHPYAKRSYVYEHRLVMEQMLGRHLEPHENVHHINGDRACNTPENLELWVTPQPSGQRAGDLYKQDVERLARENYALKQRVAELEAALRSSISQGVLYG